MRTVASSTELLPAVRIARSEAKAAFGDASVYLDRRIIGPRNIEIKLHGDQHGTVIPFVERECSIQRRHQKVVEESPSVAISDATRRAMAEGAEKVARSVGYSNAGTIEFLVDAEEQFYFLEMNTRLQVEHPVTEMVTGLDLVQWQLRIAMGERLTIAPERALTPRAHAIECRLYAEDPDRGFMPSPGLVRGISVPGGPGVRDDRGVAPGFDIPVFYDSMISKLVVWADTREDAVRRLTRALDEYRVVGVRTTLPFFRWLVRGLVPRGPLRHDVSRSGAGRAQGPAVRRAHAAGRNARVHRRRARRLVPCAQGGRRRDQRRRQRLAPRGPAGSAAMRFEVEIGGDRTSVWWRSTAWARSGRLAGAFAPRSMVTRTKSRCRQTDLGVSLAFDDGRSVDVAATETAMGEWFVLLRTWTSRLSSIAAGGGSVAAGRGLGRGRCNA